VKVLDFGIAKLMDHAAWTTQKNIVLGTMLYMSPEQVQGLTLTPQSDIYALGLIMYTALFGRHPCLLGLENATFAELTRIQVTRNPPALDELDPRIPSYVARLVGRAITKLPEERHASMRQFAADIRQSLERYVGETRQQHKVLQTRDLSHADPNSASGFRVQMAAAAPFPDATDTHSVSRPAFLGDVSAELAARVAALGPGGTVPLPRDVVVPPNFAPLTPIIAPPTQRPPSAPPVAQDTSQYGSPGSRRAPSSQAPSSADKPTLLSVPASLKLVVTPSTAPPVERQVAAMQKRQGSVPVLGPAHVPDAVPQGVPRRMSPLRKAAMGGIALGAIIGVGGGLVLASGQPTTSSAAAPSGIVVESITPQPVSPPPAPEPKAAPAESSATAPVADAAAAPPKAPTTIAPSKPAAASKPSPVAANDKLQPRLLSSEQDLKTKPASKPKPAPKSVPKAIDVGSGLAF
jgi:hypothetical protein